MQTSQGGLNKIASQFELLRAPGEATRLKNFEVSTEGGYRRINGYSQFGDGTRPNSGNAIKGLQVYADGLVTCSGTNIYFSQDGDSWLLQEAEITTQPLQVVVLQQEPHKTKPLLQYTKAILITES